MIPLASASATERDTALDRAQWQQQFHSRDRTYFREHRLRAYQESRTGLQQGANCVTPRGVCWVAEPLAQGRSCTCEDRSSDTIEGIVGG